MFISEDSVWGPEGPKSKGVITAVVINGAYAGIYFIFASMYSFLAVPMFGDEMKSGPTGMIVQSLIYMAVLDVVAIWRLLSLNSRWVTTGWKRAVKASFQLAYISIILYANFWMFTVVWFWFGHF